MLGSISFSFCLWMQMTGNGNGFAECNGYRSAVSAPNSCFLINKELQNSRLVKGLDKAGPFFRFQCGQFLVRNLPLLPSSDHSPRRNHVYLLQSSWCKFSVWRLFEICFKFTGTWPHCHSFEMKLGRAKTKEKDRTIKQRSPALIQTLFG